MNNLGGDFTLRYSWTQKVDGSWPIKSEEITEVALSDSKHEDILLSNFWEWEFTQYDSERGSKPPANDSYVVSFEGRGKIRVTATGGSKTGKHALRGRSIQIEMKRLNWFNCGKDDNLQVFFRDLQRGSEFFINEGQLQITMTTDSGIISFKKR